MFICKSIIRANILFLLAIYVEAVQLPSSFTPCKLSDSNFDECLSDAIDKALKGLKTGWPELGIPSINPMEAKSMIIGEGTGVVNVVQHYTDVKVYGYDNVTVTKAHYDAANKTLKFTVLVPKVQQKANYEFKGKILLIPVHGTGYSVQIVDNVVYDHEIHFEEFKKNNKIYLEPKLYNLKITVSHASYHFDNLFDGNKNLADNLLKVINDEWKSLFDDIKSGIEAGYAAIFQSYAKRIFAKVPAEEIFLK